MKAIIPYHLTLFLFLFIETCHAQETTHSYHLSIGDELFLKSNIEQRTESENQGIKGSVSLDINSVINMLVVNKNIDDNYIFECYYSGLELSFFSPGSSITINSKSSAFSPILNYLNKLENRKFHIELSATGEIINIYQLDSIIQNFYILDDYNPSNSDIFIKTVNEGFGKEALRGLLNVALNIYSEEYDEVSKKQTDIYFNAKILSAQNTFFYQTDNNGNFRMQGVGIINKDEETIDLEEFSMNTIMHGDQTYDYIVNPENGWILQGYSKQNIHSLSVLKNYSNGPEGLKIPSFSKTEYQFIGGVTNNNME